MTLDGEELDPRLEQFTDGQLSTELHVRKMKRIRQQLDRLGQCEQCGARFQSYESNVIETFRSAPNWRGWPAPPPPEYERIDGHRFETKMVCENGHETVREDIRFRDAVKA